MKLIGATKLSKTQKEVIAFMREGKELCTIFYSRGSSPNVIANKRVPEPTFNKLSNFKLIILDRTTVSKTGLERSFYHLTELGKTIKL